MMAKRMNINRRTFLRGAGGVALSLPIPRIVWRSDPRVAKCPGGSWRCMWGTDSPWHGDWSWYPKLVDGQMRFGKSMEAFNPLAKHVTIVKGLEHPHCVSAGGHSTADSFLTGSNPLRNGEKPVV